MNAAELITPREPQEAGTSPASASLSVRGLQKSYGSFIALHATDLEVADGEFLSLLGPSGSGKTTLLSLIAGLASADDGRVLLGRQDITRTAPYERDIGVVFQNYALFPHMSVADNIAFPLRMRKLPADDIARRVAEALDMVRLPHVADRFPRELSGGQQQRIALARCLVYRPSLILMDEPLGALDKKLREQMQLEIKRIHRELRKTIIYVTHDQEEAMTMSDRICLMSAGRIEQLGEPTDLYFRPRTLLVADFLGESNLMSGTVKAVAGEEIVLEIAGGTLDARALGNGANFRPGDKATIMIRPQNLTAVPGRGGPGKIGGRVSDVMVNGALTRIYVAPRVPLLPALVAAFPTRPAGQRHAIGDLLDLSWSAADAVAIPEAGVA